MATLKTRPVTHEGHRLDSEGVTPVESITTPSAARKVWAATRISLGFVFLWAFLDKAFALGFATGRAEDGTVAYFGEGAAGSSRASPATPSPTCSSWSACSASAWP
jgi:thiosulfate dehydrogenase (quinone) large subunit